MSEKFGLPEDIKKSIAAGNTEHLRNAGRRGAEVANRNRDIKNTLNDIAEEERKFKLAKDEAERMHSANEHIITPDGDDTGWTPDDEPFESGDHYIIGSRH